jgi:hypothetical protein
MKERETNEQNIKSLFLVCNHSGLTLGEFCGNCGVILLQPNVNKKFKIIGMH